MSDKVAELEEKLAEAEAEKKALSALVMDEPCHSGDRAQHYYRLYSKMPPKDRPVLKDIQASITAFLQQIAALQDLVLAKQEALARDRSGTDSEPNHMFTITLTFRNRDIEPMEIGVENVKLAKLWQSMCSRIQQYVRHHKKMEVYDLLPLGFEDAQLATSMQKVVDTTSTVPDESGIYHLSVSGMVEVDNMKIIDGLVVTSVDDIISTTSTTATVRVNMRQKLLDGAPGNSYQNCTILEQVSPGVVFADTMSVGAHIIRRAVRGDAGQLHLCKLLLDGDHHGPRNGIIMSRVLEAQFDRLMWCFIPSDTTRVVAGSVPYRIKLFGYQPLKWVEDSKGSSHPQPDPLQTELSHSQACALEVILCGSKGEEIRPSGVKWGELEDKPIWLPETVSTTALLLHAAAAHKRAKCFNDFKPEAFKLKKRDSPPRVVIDNIKSYLASVEPPGPDDALSAST